MNRCSKGFISTTTGTGLFAILSCDSTSAVATIRGRRLAEGSGGAIGRPGKRSKGQPARRKRISPLAPLDESSHERSGQRVVLLVDENDKPILDALAVPEVARANRDFLHSLYATTKDCDAHIHFTFLTGVSQFSKASIFSGLNNLTNITLDARYSAICGYTDADLDTVFAPELPGLDREEIRDWYNGL